MFTNDLIIIQLPRNKIKYIHALLELQLFFFILVIKQEQERILRGETTTDDVHL